MKLMRNACGLLLAAGLVMTSAVAASADTKTTTVTCTNNSTGAVIVVQGNICPAGFSLLDDVGGVLGGGGGLLGGGVGQNTAAGKLCAHLGGAFVDLGSVAYACVLPTQASPKQIRHAQKLCGTQGGLFVSAGNLVYACVLPGQVVPVGGLPIPGTGGLLGSGVGGLRLFPILLGQGGGILSGGILPA